MSNPLMIWARMRCFSSRMWTNILLLSSKLYRFLKNNYLKGGQRDLNYTEQYPSMKFILHTNMDKDLNDISFGLSS